MEIIIHIQTGDVTGFDSPALALAETLDHLAKQFSMDGSVPDNIIIQAGTDCLIHNANGKVCGHVQISETENN